MTRAWIGLAVLACCGLVGCGSSDATADAKKSLGDFLEAVRQGNDAQAEAMLTPLARQKTKEADMTVTPPGRDTAKYEMVATEAAGEGQININVKWTDINEAGQPSTDDIVWLMKKTEEGWRVAGMQAKPFTDLGRFLLNFENPADMQVQLQRINQEYANRNNGGPSQPEPRQAEAIAEDNPSR